jgi:hypothetical protein
MRRWIARWSRAKRAGPDGQRPDIFGDRCEFGDREIVVDQDRHAATRVERPEFRRLQVAGVERQRLAMIRNTLVFKREPDPRRASLTPNRNELTTVRL